MSPAPFATLHSLLLPFSLITLPLSLCMNSSTSLFVTSIGGSPIINLPSTVNIAQVVVTDLSILSSESLVIKSHDARLQSLSAVKTGLEISIDVEYGITTDLIPTPTTSEAPTSTEAGTNTTDLLLAALTDAMQMVNDSLIIKSQEALEQELSNTISELQTQLASVIALPRTHTVTLGPSSTICRPTATDPRNLDDALINSLAMANYTVCSNWGTLNLQPSPYPVLTTTAPIGPYTATFQVGWLPYCDVTGTNMQNVYYPMPTDQVKNAPYCETLFMGLGQNCKFFLCC